MRLEAAGWDPAWKQQFEPHAAAGMQPGRIFTRNRHIYGVYCLAGEMLAEVSGAFAHGALPNEFPAVGDWVAFRPSEAFGPGEVGGPSEAFRPGVAGGPTAEQKTGQTTEHTTEQKTGPAIIHALLPRRTKLARKVAGNATEEQVIAANVDVLFIVCGLDLDYNLRRLERYVVAAGESGTAVVLVLNKADLCEDIEARMAEIRTVAAGHPIVTLSAIADGATAALYPYFQAGKTAALLGSSGAGKSTIVNGLLGDARQPVQPTREADGRGRHTTTSRELFLLPNGGLILDNPGIRELQLWPEQASVVQAFPEIEALAALCAFRNCGHQGDEGCAVQAALLSGELDEGRWNSYLKLHKELRRVTVSVDENARRKEKKRVKKLCGDAKRFDKRSADER